MVRIHVGHETTVRNLLNNIISMPAAEPFPGGIGFRAARSGNQARFIPKKRKNLRRN
jgi:hypothetical protein